MTLRLPTRVKPRSPAFSLNVKERQLDNAFSTKAKENHQGS